MFLTGIALIYFVCQPMLLTEIDFNTSLYGPFIRSLHIYLGYYFCIRTVWHKILIQNKEDYPQANAQHFNEFDSKTTYISSKAALLRLIAFYKLQINTVHRLVWSHVEFQKLHIASAIIIRRHADFSIKECIKVYTAENISR